MVRQLLIPTMHAQYTMKNRFTKKNIRGLGVLLYILGEYISGAEGI